MVKKDRKGHVGEKKRRKEATMKSLLKYTHDRSERNEAAKHNRVQKATAPGFKG